jgi:hypothetical protein
MNILVIALCAIIGRADDWVSVVQFGKSQEGQTTNIYAKVDLEALRTLHFEAHPYGHVLS